MTAGITRIGDRRTFFRQLPLVIAGPTIGDRRTFFLGSKQCHGFPKPLTGRPVSPDKGTLQSVICLEQRGERAIARLLIEKLNYRRPIGAGRTNCRACHTSGRKPRPSGVIAASRQPHTTRHSFALWTAVSGGGSGGSAGGRRPTGRPLSYAENTALAGDATREADAREAPSSTRSSRSPAMTGRSTPHRFATRRGPRGPSLTQHRHRAWREWRPALCSRREDSRGAGHLRRRVAAASRAAKC